jgi:hypothetical protein
MLFRFFFVQINEIFNPILGLCFYRITLQDYVKIKVDEGFIYFDKEDILPLLITEGVDSFERKIIEIKSRKFKIDEVLNEPFYKVLYVHNLLF